MDKGRSISLVVGWLSSGLSGEDCLRRCCEDGLSTDRAKDLVELAFEQLPPSKKHWVEIDRRDSKTKKENTMKDSNVDLSNLSIAELATTYNLLADSMNLPHVKKFTDKKTGVRRVTQLREQAESEGKLAGPPDVEDLIPEEKTEIKDGAKVDIPDSEIKVPEEKLTSKKDLDAVKVPRVTKASIIRNLFESSGSLGVTWQELSKASGHTRKHVVSMMWILADPKRTADPIEYVKVKGTYYHPQFAPKTE